MKGNSIKKLKDLSDILQTFGKTPMWTKHGAWVGIPVQVAGWVVLDLLFPLCVIFSEYFISCTSQGSPDGTVPVLQVLSWPIVQEDHYLNLQKYVGVGDCLYFLSVGQHFQARVISWVSFRENMGISKAFERGAKNMERIILNRVVWGEC